MPAMKIRELETLHGDLHRIVPDLVNAYGQWEAGRRLGVSGTTVCRWLHQNGYRRRTLYVRDEKQERAK